MYCGFIWDYCKVVSLRTRLIKKEGGKYVPFVWGPAQRKAFENLKKVFTTVLILNHFDYNRNIVVKTITSDYVLAGILSQYDDEDILHLVPFYSMKHSPAKCN
jgi:hypothetical protein